MIDMNLEVTDFHSSESVSDCPQKYQPEYAFIGRSNVGKSSLINTLLKQKLFTLTKLFILQIVD